ncbi:S1/P1 nuclease [Parvibaculum sp.]|uniref:S1/P1 nuclease n=1 Tax=Parvibaculum sp. TaxID=2024848 RepID=UPI00386216DE
MPSTAWAWGSEGHEVVALIAAAELTPATRAKVGELIGGDAAGAMADASTWADRIRRDRPETAPWHYVDIEITSAGYDPMRCRATATERYAFLPAARFPVWPCLSRPPQ